MDFLVSSKDVTLKIIIVLFLSTALVACGSGGDPDNSGNSSPAANAGANQIAEERTSVALSGSGTDTDGSIASYSWQQTAGTSVTLTNFDSATATFFAPDVTSDETLTFQLTVTDDNNATATDTIDVVIQNVNLPPSANAGANQIAEERTSVALSGSGTDTDGSIASYSWQQTAGTSVTLTNFDSATATFFAPDVTSDETLTFQLTVTDDLGKSSDDSIDIKVNNFFNKNIILRVVKVTEDWMPYASTGGWTQAVKSGNKESGSVKYFEVAIWEEVASVHLYAFDNDFDPLYEQRHPDLTDEQKIEYREKYRLMKFEGLPLASDYQARSEFLRDSFIDIVNNIVSQYPNADHHLIYNGHGGPGGRLFAGELLPRDVKFFLESWILSLGHDLGVIDMGGPCNKGSLADLENFCQYADYYIASDLPNGGYTYDEYTAEKDDETNVELQYHHQFADSVNLREALVKRIDLKRKKYEYSVVNMTENKVEQGNYLYSCSSYKTFNEVFAAFIYGKSDYTILSDLLHYLESKNASDELINKFHDVIIHSADNRDFFEWEFESNGLTMDDPY